MHVACRYCIASGRWCILISNLLLNCCDEMTRSDVTHMLVKQSSSLSMETLDFISPDLCPPSNPVVYRIWGLVQECTCTMSAPVLDTIGAVSGNGIIKINLLLHAFPVVTAKERNVISIAFRHRSVHDGYIVEVLQVNGLDGTCWLY